MKGLEQIAEERHRQLDDLGWSPAHDRTHTDSAWVWLIQTRTTDLLDPVTDEDPEYRDRLYAQIGALAAAAIGAGRNR